MLQAIERTGLSRKEFADEIQVDGGERTVSHWVTGATWPRDRRDVAMDEIEAEVMRVLGFPRVGHQEREILEACRDESVRAAVLAAINEAREE